MTGALAKSNNKITGLAAPTSNNDAATKDYADTKVSKAGESMTGNLDMTSSYIRNLQSPSTYSDAVNKMYVQTNSVFKRGETMTGAFNMGGHWITNLSKATSPNNAVTLTRLGESHISKHENRKDVFKYIVENANESEEDYTLSIRNIVTTTNLPHKIHLKAYLIIYASFMPSPCSAWLGA